MEDRRQQSVRVQTSILNAAEKKALTWIAERLPRWVKSDMLTAVGALGAMIIAAGYILSNNDIRWLWLSTFGYIVNWFGDSLDGSIARVRKQQRPIYGFFLDHTIDGINEAFMFIGAGLSPLMNLSSALFALSAYLLLSMYVYISAHLKNEFKLTYSGLGPTEFRIIMIIVNTLFIYVSPLRDYVLDVTMLGHPVTFRVLDFISLAIALILLIMYIVSVIHDAKEYARIDPLPEGKEDR